MKIVDGKKVIWETNNFEVVASDHPFISREEGGHIIIRGKDNKYRYNSRLDFSPSEVLEQQRLCQMICEAYKKAMQKHDVSRETSGIYIKIEKATLFCEIKWLFVCYALCFT